MIDFEIVKRQIIKACKNQGIDEVKDMRAFVDFFRWYYQRYFECFGREHKRLTTESVENAIYYTRSFLTNDGGMELLKELAEQYFICEFSKGTDYSITHFACPGILQNRIYEISL